MQTCLVILESHVAQQGVVLFHFPFELLHARLVLVNLVSDNESLVEFDNLTEREVLPGRAVQPSRGLNELDDGCRSFEKR